jgi:hypothetical protein
LTADSWKQLWMQLRDCKTFWNKINASCTLWFKKHRTLSWQVAAMSRDGRSQCLHFVSKFDESELLALWKTHCHQYPIFTHDLPLLSLMIARLTSYWPLHNHYYLSRMMRICRERLPKNAWDLARSKHCAKPYDVLTLQLMVCRNLQMDHDLIFQLM